MTRARGKRRSPTRRRVYRRGAEPEWVSDTDEELLERRICDLGVKIEGTPLEARIARLHHELAAHGIRFKPHCWLSTEWFSPDGVPGIGIPFFLAHPRLMKLEARQMLEVEGGTATACMRILRHEAGHAIDTAFRLHFKKSWRETFGRYSERYPKHYRPKPNSRSYVLHLDGWYAQAHPAEDFAETFAVWLTPRSGWRRAYEDWPLALGKLVYVDGLMHQIKGTAPPVRSRLRVEPVSRIRSTLGQYYKRKRRHYGAAWPEDYDRDLLRLFSNDRSFGRRPTAATFLRKIRSEIRVQVSRWTGAHPYTIDQVLQDMIERSRELRLRLAVPSMMAKTQAVVLVTVHTMNCLSGRRHEIPL